MGCIEEAHASFSRAQALAQGHPNTDCQINLKNFS
jgi:protein O-GlcNAc transferase